MTLQELELAVYDATGGLSDAPEESIVRRVRRSLNTWHARFLTRPGMERLREDVYAMTTTDGTAEYALRSNVAQIRGISQRSQSLVLREASLDELRACDPGLTATGGPSQVWIPMGTRAVEDQPSSASGMAIYVKSTAAGDTQTAFLEGVRFNGYPYTATATMTGTTAVALGTQTDVIQIDRIGLASPAAGTVTWHESSGAGATLAQIPIGETSTRYAWIRLWPTPDGETYHVDYTRAIEDLRQPRSEPLLPPDFHDLLIDGAIYDEWLRRQDLSAAQLVRNGMREREAALTRWVLNGPTYRPSMRPEITGSNLGGYYPAGYW